MSEPISWSAGKSAVWSRPRLMLEERLGEPNWVAVLIAASAAGVAVVSLYRFQHRLGTSFTALFVKEGPLEHVTVILALLAAAWCASAVWYYSRKGALDAPPPHVRWMFGALAGSLFFVGMEEINWGQTFLRFNTPAAWKEVNLQQETSLHNVAGRNALEGFSRSLGVLVTVITIILVAIRARAERSFLGQIAPHPALLPLSLVIAFAAFRQHSEVVELLVSVFFAFYTYRLWSLAKMCTRPAGVRFLVH